MNLELENLNFSCQLNRTSQQIDFSWANLLGVDYKNLSIVIKTNDNQTIGNLVCDPYVSSGICSTRSYRFEPGKEYEINAKLTKIFANFHGQRTETCSIKTSQKIFGFLFDKIQI